MHGEVGPRTQGVDIDDTQRTYAERERHEGDGQARLDVAQHLHRCRLSADGGDLAVNVLEASVDDGGDLRAGVARTRVVGGMPWCLREVVARQAGMVQSRCYTCGKRP